MSGPAFDFCLVVTQRRHVDDTALSVVGDGARQWMEIAQAFAGPPTIRTKEFLTMSRRSYETLLLDVDDHGVATLTLNRP